MAPFETLTANSNLAASLGASNIKQPKATSLTPAKQSSFLAILSYISAFASPSSFCMTWLDSFSINWRRCSSRIAWNFCCCC